MKNLNIFRLLPAIVLIASCSSVRFSGSPGGNQTSGLKYYSPKPYVQVERDAVSGSVMKSTLFFLPDMENPQYMYIKPGIGSSKADVKLENGILTNFGTATDTDIPGIISSMAALVGKGGEAVSDLSQLKTPVPGDATATVTEIYELVMADGITTARRIELK